MRVTFCFASALSLVAIAKADDPAFPFTPEQFIKLYDSHIDPNSYEDQALSIQHSQGRARAVLGDKFFKQAVIEMKRLDLMNGPVPMRMSMEFEVNPQGFVTVIGLSSYRDDPLNLFRGAGMIGEVYLTLNPTSAPDDVTDFQKRVGLLRGDADPTIGQPRTEITRGAVFTCINSPSQENLQFGCVVIPRS